MHDRKFRFGVLCKWARSRREFTELARKAEDLGYSTLFVPDHFVLFELGPVVALGYAAAVTETIRLGTLVLGNDYRHPVVLARDAATVDVLSDGRLELGIGAGWMTADYEQSGVELEPAGVRIARLAESITVLKGLFADGPLNFEGEYYRVTDLDGMPKPVQRPYPPFIIGGGGPKILSLAAREAQIVSINADLRSGDHRGKDAARSLTVAATDEKLTRLRDAAGVHFADLEIHTYIDIVHVADNSAVTAESVLSSAGITEDESQLGPVMLVGSEDQVVEQLQRWRELWDMSYVVMPIESAEEFAPVVARLAGT